MRWGKQPKQTGTPPPAKATDTSAPSSSGAGNGRFCTEARATDERFDSLKAAGARALFTYGQQATSVLADLAPAEIRADFDVLVRSYRLYLDELRKVDFDLARLPPDVRPSLNTPQVRAASDRIDAYRRNNCGASP